MEATAADPTAGPGDGASPRDAGGAEEDGASGGRAPDSGMEESILEAAGEILAEEGAEALSMRAVAGRVGISATAIYHYFENKRDLVDRVVYRAYRHLQEYGRKQAEAVPRGSLERLRALAEGYIRFALDHEQHFRVLFALQSERLREMEDHPATGGYEMVLEAVTEAMDAGELERRDPRMVSLYVWSSVHGLVTLSLACKLEVPPGGRQVKALELFDEAWEMIVDGLRPREERGQ